MNTRRMHHVFAMLLLLMLLAACGAMDPTATPTNISEPATEDNAAPTQAPDSGGTTSEEPLVIGIAVAETSNVALFGQEQVAGAKLAERIFNERGGVNGRPIKLVFQDTSGDEAGAINAFQALINQDNVVAIVGPTLSQQAFSAHPIAEQAKVPAIGPSNTAPGIPEAGEYIARVSAPVTVVAPNAVRVALELDPAIKDVVVMYAENDAFSKSETVVFQRVVTDTYKLNLASVQTFQTTDSDFTTQATAALNANPQLIVISGLAADGGTLVRQLRELGYEGLIIGGNGFNTTNIFPVCQQYCEGIIVAQAYSPLYQSEINEAFVSAYKAEQQKDPPQFSAQAFAGVQVIVEALIALDNAVDLNTLDLAGMRTALNETLLATKYPDTPLGPLSFTPEGEIQQEQFYVGQIKMNADGTDGTFELK